MWPACRVPLDVAELACMEFGRTVVRELGAKGGLHPILSLQPCLLSPREPPEGLKVVLTCTSVPRLQAEGCLTLWVQIWMLMLFPGQQWSP